MNGELEVVVGIFALVIIIIIFWRIAAGGLDKNRVAEHICQKGGTILDIHWAPFGRGWIASEKNRIYEVTYLDSDGKKHIAICQTSALGGVYWTEDRIIGPEPEKVTELDSNHEEIPSKESIDSELRRLRQENEALKDEIERLKKQEH